MMMMVSMMMMIIIIIIIIAILMILMIMLIMLMSHFAHHFLALRLEVVGLCGLSLHLVDLLGGKVPLRAFTQISV